MQRRGQCRESIGLIRARVNGSEQAPNHSVSPGWRVPGIAPHQEGSDGSSRFSPSSAVRDCRACS